MMTDQLSNNALTPTNCISYRLRRAARTAAKRFDAALRPAGIRNTQFTFLAALDQLGPTSVGDLSKILAMDQTTVTRNLKLLIRNGFIQEAPAEDGRVHLATLSKDGEKVFQQALPLWRQMQTQLLETLQTDFWNGMVKDLEEIEKACAKTP